MSVRGRVYVFLLVVAVLAGGFYWGNQSYKLDEFSFESREEEKEDEDKKDGEDETIPIEVEAAETGPIAAQVYSTANLRALRDVTLKAQTPGVIREIRAEEGQFVKAGQLLALLDDRELRINLELAKQRLEQTRVQLDSAKILREKAETQIAAKQQELARNEKALAEGLVSDTDVALLRNQLADLRHDERAQAASVRENEYRVEELESEIERNEVLVSHTRVTAPFAGRIVERTAELGQTVTSADSLFRLATFSPLYADIFIAEQDSRRVRPNQKAAISLGAAGDETAEGRVVRISPVVDDSTGTVKVTAELRPQDPTFRPGAFVRVRIETDVRQGAILIPKRAVVEQDGGTYVFVNKGETAERREVELGYENGAAVEVRKGVSAGEEIVVAGQGQLKDGDKTRVVTS